MVFTTSQLQEAQRAAYAANLHMKEEGRSFPATPSKYLQTLTPGQLEHLDPKGEHPVLHSLPLPNRTRYYLSLQLAGNKRTRALIDIAVQEEEEEEPHAL